MTSGSRQPSDAANCKIFRGANYLQQKLDGSPCFLEQRSITRRAAIPLIFLGLSFSRLLVPRPVRTKLARYSVFVAEALFVIASRLDTADRFFPTARSPAQSKTGISPDEMSSRIDDLALSRG
jgi:hypothetical protein